MLNSYSIQYIKYMAILTAVSCNAVTSSIDAVIYVCVFMGECWKGGIDSTSAGWVMNGIFDYFQS